MVKRPQSYVAFATAALAGLVGCTGIIGVREIFLDENGAASGVDGGPDLPDGTVADDRDGTTTPETCNADLTSDPKNCGACDHDCIGGTCSESTCQPVVVTTLADGQPYGLDVDDTSIYFSDVGGDAKGIIYKIDKRATNAAPTMLAETTDPLIYDLRVDSAGVVFASGSVSNSNGVGVVESVAKAGGAKHLIASTKVPRGLSLDGTSAYWYAAESDPIDIEGASRTGSDGGAPKKFAAAEADSTVTYVDGLALFWAKPSTMRRCTLPACVDKTSIATLDRTPVAVASNGTLLFFGGDDKVFVMPKTATSGAMELATGQNQISWIAADDKAVVWADTGTNDQSFQNGAIVRCTLSGSTCSGGPVIVAHSTHNPRVIAMDATAIYWTEQYGGTVWRVAR